MTHPAITRWAIPSAAVALAALTLGTLGDAPSWVTTAATVAALAAATLSLGRGFQVRTLLATLFVLWGQKSLLAAADASAAATGVLVTLAVAVYLHRLALPGAPRHEPHAALIGILTAAAAHLHVAGAALVWLLPLQLWEQGRVDRGRFARKTAYWVAGLAGGWLLSAALGLGTGGAASGEGPGWLALLWSLPPAAPGSGTGLQILGLLTVGAALAAAGAGRSIQRRLLHLLPGVYLLVLVGGTALAGSAPRLPQDLLPIVPASCLLAGTLFQYAGLEEISWREMLSARFLLPALAAAGFVALVAGPYLSGSLPATSLVPGAGPVAAENLVRRTLGPGLILAALSMAILLAHRRRRWLLLLLIGSVLTLGPAALG